MHELTKPIRSKIIKSNKRLSIQVNLSGLSFCIYNPNLHAIEHFYTLSLSSQNVKSEVLDFVNSISELSQIFDSVKVIHDNLKFTLVPEQFFSSNTPKEYLKFVATDIKNNLVFYDNLSMGAINVYLPDIQINTLFRDFYHQVTYTHFSSILLELLQKYETSLSQIVYLYIDETYFYMAIFNEKSLVFFNAFEYKTSLDLLYYVLFSLEQVDIDPKKVSVFLLGKDSSITEIYDLLYQYIGNIGFLPFLPNAPFWHNDKKYLAKSHFVLTHSFF